MKQLPDNAVCVFEGVLYSVWHWNQEMFDGSVETFEMLKRPDTVEVIAIVDDKILIQKEEQPHVGEFYDVPGGRHDYKGENELECAKRELREETGYSLSEWKLVYAVQHASKIDHVSYVFVAYGDYEKSDQNLDNGEKIEVELVTFDEFMKKLSILRSHENIESSLSEVKSLEDIKQLQDLYRD